MIRLIHGAKGSGKTNRIIDCANIEVVAAKGQPVFITDTNQYSRDIGRHIRYVNINEYNIKTEPGFLGFIKGMTAANSDITDVYVDGLNRFLVAVDKMEGLLTELDKISSTQNITFTLTISTDTIPEFMKRYI